MGVQRFATKEKIGTLTNLGASVQLGPSRLTIGGQQYITSSNLTVAYPALTANTLYMIYAVQTAGVVSIVISTNFNSVGPTNFSSWKLVGAFYSDGATGSVAFGSFVNIEGIPSTDLITFTPVLRAAANLVTMGSGSISTGRWYRRGEQIHCEVQFVSGSSASTGVGSFNSSVPFPFNHSKMRPDTGSIASTLGAALGTSGAPAASTGFNPTPNYISAQDRIYWYQGDAGIGNSQVSDATPGSGWFTGAAGRILTAIVEYPVSGWSNTPIKDL